MSQMGHFPASLALYLTKYTCAPKTTKTVEREDQYNYSSNQLVPVVEVVLLISKQALSTQLHT